MKPQKIKTKTESTQKVQFVVSGQPEALADLLLDGVELDQAQRDQQLLGDLRVLLLLVSKESPEFLLNGCPGPWCLLLRRALQDLLQTLQLLDGDVLIHHKVYHGLFAVVVFCSCGGKTAQRLKGHRRAGHSPAKAPCGTPAQEGGECPGPGRFRVQGQAGWALEQPGLGEDFPAHGREAGSFTVPSNSNHSMSR